MFDDLIVERNPPKNRQGKCDGSKERHLTEAAVMLAYGMHLLRTVPGLSTVELHPDGEHAKRFDIPRWLSVQGFILKQRCGKTIFGGTYVRGPHTVLVEPKPGKGDVVAKTESVAIVAECKGGIVNTRRPGQKGRLRKGLCEAVGQLMASPRVGRQVVVVPHTETTLRLAQKLAPRAKDAGIEIFLVDDKGNVMEVKSEGV